VRKRNERNLTEVEENVSIKNLVSNQIGMLVMFLGLILILVFVIRLLIKNSHSYFEQAETKKKIGALYKDLKTDSKFTINYASFYLARRLFVAAVFVLVETIALKV
jgi:NADH:ubiquinone oxidoreductase subunit H